MWQKRWFILSNCELSYASSQSAAPSRTISLARCTGMTRDNGNACSFSVDTGHRIFRQRPNSTLTSGSSCYKKLFRLPGVPLGSLGRDPGALNKNNVNDNIPIVTDLSKQREFFR